ncbi:hypothetical protein AB6A40_000458 [Gnathostoma spinigerum]|uniref:Uncharacterized protein n=1 Tax=Gnathostoma spinigerum TaxID=75299 RepID=A0ABD6E6I1_9BILA
MRNGLDESGVDYKRPRFGERMNAAVSMPSNLSAVNSSVSRVRHDKGAETQSGGVSSTMVHLDETGSEAVTSTTHEDEYGEMSLRAGNSCQSQHNDDIKAVTRAEDELLANAIIYPEEDE